MDTSNNSQRSDLTSHAGRYLTFRLADEFYGVQVTAVQEIIGLLPITRLPHSASFVRGVINLRGKVIPVVDLRVKFDVACEPDTERTCIVVAQVMIDDEAVVIGAIVDEVAEVVDVGIAAIEPPPTFGTGIDTEFITGMGKLQDRVLILLDVERVLGGRQLVAG